MLHLLGSPPRVLTIVVLNIADSLQVVVSCDNDGQGVTGPVLHVLDLATGKILSTFSGMAETESSAAVGHDGIYVGSMDGCVRKIV